ncbi:hypothetical protein BKA66DRAFT_405610 [Pyrenochaeta sp. MPI-SDFR-AT-0127]|nr:hypothetical protein BKA66DRAFT_405610 [Pyrenochaeta sp. MPI-SDFR-AT-0127]
MTVPDNIAPFFTMPLELRQQIYTEIFASPLQGSELLRTCREIKAQAHKFLFQRPANFRSQSSLYEWLDRVPHELLQHVTEVSLSVQDVDLRALLQTDTSFQQTDTSPRLRSSELYGIELERLRRSLIQLPKVKKITIRALSSRQSFLYHDFLAKVLEMLSAVYPDLLEIRLEGNMHHQDLTFLTNLRKLQSLSFDGFSSTSSTKTAGILASLEHLSKLSLISQHEMPTSGNHSHSGLRTKQQSFTGDVARTINQLATFSVTERIPTSSPPLFFTSEVLASLHNHKALKSLSISLSKTPDGETLESLRVFLKRSAIERLELDWPDLEPQLLEEFALIQSDLKILWVRAKNETDACDIISSISEKREIGDLQGLRQVVLIRSNVEYGNAVVGTSNRKDSGTGETEGVTFNVSLFSLKSAIHTNL